MADDVQLIYPQEAMYAPIGAFLVLLAQGWRLGSIAEAADVGGYSVVLWRPL